MPRDGLELREQDAPGFEPAVEIEIDPPAGAGGPGQVLVPGILARLWTRQAGDGLAMTHPELSARSGLTRWQKFVAAMLLASMAGGLVMLPGIAVPTISIGAGLVFSAAILLRLIAGLNPVRHTLDPALADDDLPRLSVIIALYREAAVVPRLIAALDALDYPANRLEIRLALEADDTLTAEAIARQTLDRRYLVVKTPPGLPRTKPRALNYALRFCSGEIIAVFDAEDRPDPAQPRRAAARFAAEGARTACVQAPLNWFNRDDNWLTRQFALEYATHFQVMLPFFAALGWPLPLGGTSNYLRATVLRAAGGWDAHNVTEDADLGFRLHGMGYRSTVIAGTTLEEAPVRLRPWVFQRTRWLKGYLQTLAVHARNPVLLWRSGALPGLCLTMGLAALSALVHAPFLLVTALLATTGNLSGEALWLTLGFSAAGYGVNALCAITGMRRAGLAWHWSSLAGMPFYWPLQTLAMIRAIWQLLTNPFFWDKTEHGLSREPADPCISPCPPLSSPLASASRFSSSRDGEAASPPDRRAGSE